MANTRDIRRRIKSVKNTSQITKAMEMVSASKMRKAQQAAITGRPYSELLNRVLVSLRDRVDAVAHQLLAVREVKKTLVLLVTSDKGLCGALNTNVLREASFLNKETTDFVAVGRKGASFLARTGRHMIADFQLSERPTFLQTKAISKFCLQKFLSGEADSVKILYPKFVNTLIQRPITSELLPITAEKAQGMIPLQSPATGGRDLSKIAPNDELQGTQGTSNRSGLTPPEDVNVSTTQQFSSEVDLPKDSMGEYIFEPDATQVLDAILPYSFHFEIFQKILDARASEQSARMVAMKAATDNAKSLVKDLTLEYNKARQAAITTELLEISTAQMVLG
ncbi:MAG: ATP synthase F1 subunit gamma [Chthoniobacterales bacterium]